MGNGSDPLEASLYVPWNDKLVDIDGKLRFHLVLSCEKAMALNGSADNKNQKVGLGGDLTSSIPIIYPHLY